MFRKLFPCKSIKQLVNQGRSLRFEQCEDRRMLTVMADVIFLVDGSGSGDDFPTQDWLTALVTGDNNSDNTKDVSSLTEELAVAGITNVRYGLVGFGQINDSNSDRYAHSQLFTPGDDDSLFGAPGSLTTTQLNNVFSQLEIDGAEEDGWDAIEHAIAEYKIRDGAVPIFVLVQNEEGRQILNNTLRRAGIEAAMASKNVILTTVVAAPFDTAIANPVFGVESTEEDNDGDDTTHTAYIQGAGAAFTSSVFDDDLHAINGDNGIRTDLDYVDLAWSTGGSAWNINVVADEFNPAISTQNNTLIAFNDALVTSLANQIKAAEAKGKVFREDVVLLARNLGGGKIEGFLADDALTVDNHTFVSGTTVINTFSNAIPFVNPNVSSPSKIEDVFRSARLPLFPTSQDDLTLDITTLGDGTPLHDGTYIVELFFTAIANTTSVFDVKLEGVTLLDNYKISSDRAKIVPLPNEDYELDVSSSGTRTGIVKRFQVDVTGDDGLQILLDSNLSTADPLLNGVRILQADAPRVKDVVLSYSDPNNRPARYVYSEVVGKGDQFRPAYYSGLDTIEIHFDSPVNFADGPMAGVLDGHELILHHSFQASDTQPSLTIGHASFEYDAINYIGKWTFTQPLDDDKYAIELSDSITGGGGQALNGNWLDPHNGTYDDFSDDLEVAFPSGNENAGGLFRFNFSVLEGDYNQDGVVDATDRTVVLDGDGDGVVEASPGNSSTSTPAGDDYVLTLGAARHLPFTKRRGDLDDDEMSSASGDWTFLISHTGLHEGHDDWDERADTNDDGIINLLDTHNFITAYENLNSYYSAWSPNRANNSPAAALFALTALDGIVFVSTTTDELDSDFSEGDLSLREAIQIANAASGPTVIILPAGHYILDRVGTEAGDASYNDLDITNDIRIVGEGAGFSVIDSSGLTGNQGRIFGMTTSSGALDVSFVTLTSGTAFLNGHGSAAYITAGASFTLSDSAVVNHNLLGSPIYVNGADITIRRSVFTNNVSEYAAAPAVGIFNSGTITIGESIFALNLGTYGTSTASVWVTGSSVVKVNEGYNLIENTSGGFFDTTPGTGDFVGTPDYVVTSMEDTFDHADDDDALSLREAIDLANNDSAVREIWLPAWDFVLTRDRATYGGGSSTDIDVAFGDLDISENLVVRGVAGKTSVTWMPGVVDKAFDLLGDYNDETHYPNGQNYVDSNDYYVWVEQNGLTGTPGQYPADGNDDGDVDIDDYYLLLAHAAHSLVLIDLSL